MSFLRANLHYINLKKCTNEWEIREYLFKAMRSAFYTNSLMEFRVKEIQSMLWAVSEYPQAMNTMNEILREFNVQLHHKED